MEPDRTQGPLDGVRVIDLTQMVAGPFCTYQLALQGASVVRIEPPGGDPIRFYGAEAPWRDLGMGPSYLAMNARKRSVVIDLKQAAGRELLSWLVRDADVLVENFRPGVLARLGLDPARLRSERPDLIICSISGFGQTGPYSDRPSYDQVLQAVTGIMSVNGTDETGPLRAAFPLVDCAAGMCAAFAIASALHGRRRTGLGDHIDATLLEAGILMMLPVVAQVLVNGADPVALGNRPFSGSPFSGVFPTGDGHLAIAGNTAKQCRALCLCIGLPDLADLAPADWPSLTPERETAIRAQVAGALAGRSAHELEALLSAQDVPVARVRSLREILAEPFLADRGFVVALRDVAGTGRDLATVTTGFRSAAWPSGDMAAPPRPGADGPAVLAEAGMDPDEIAALVAAGTVGAAPAPVAGS